MVSFKNGTGQQNSADKLMFVVSNGDLNKQGWRHSARIITKLLTDAMLNQDESSSWLLNSSEIFWKLDQLRL